MAGDRRTVLVLGARAPAALELARRFARVGWRVVVGDSIACRMTAWSRAVAARVRLPSARAEPPAYARALAEAIRRHDVGLVVPTCEESFYLSRLRDRLPDDVRVCVGEFDTLRQLHSKWRFLGLAREAGAAVPESARVTGIDDARAWAGRRAVVLKPEFSRFGMHVRLRPGGIAAGETLPPGTWVVQALHAGRELCSYAIADRGRLLAHVCYRPAYRLRRSSSYWFEAVPAPAIRDVTARLIGRLGYTGQIAFDWIEDDAGRPWVIECNPRAVSGVHLFDEAEDIPGALDGQVDGGIDCVDGRPAMLAPVMLAAGLPSAIRGTCAGDWLRDWRRAHDVIATRGDRAPLVGSLADVVSYAGDAIRRRISLREAATYDTEWDGEAMAGLDGPVA